MKTDPIWPGIVSADEKTEAILADLRSLAVAEEVAKRDRAAPVYTKAADVIEDLQGRVDYLMDIAEWVRYQLFSLCSHHQYPTPTCRVCKMAYNDLEKVIRRGRRDVSDEVGPREQEGWQDSPFAAPLEQLDEGRPEDEVFNPL